MSTAEAIYEVVKRLPEKQANIVLRFAEFLRQETSQSVDTSGELGWEPEFFEQTAGCLEDDPIVRHPQPSFDVREPIS